MWISHIVDIHRINSGTFLRLFVGFLFTCSAVGLFYLYMIDYGISLLLMLDVMKFEVYELVQHFITHLITMENISYSFLLLGHYKYGRGYPPHSYLDWP